MSDVRCGLLNNQSYVLVKQGLQFAQTPKSINQHTCPAKIAFMHKSMHPADHTDGKNCCGSPRLLMVQEFALSHQ